MAARPLTYILSMVHAASLCMFCLRDDGGFRSEEHPIPEALGNHETVLEAGVVCDRCNSGPLAYCDDALVTCPPIALLRTMQHVRSKRNRVPGALFGDGGIYALGNGGDAENSIYMRLPDDAVTHGDGMFEIELRKPWKPKQISRACRGILKAGFELLAWDNGKAYVMDQRFDGLRSAILKGGYRGWLMYTTEHGAPTPEVSVSYPAFDIEGLHRSGLKASIDAWGMRLVTAWPAREPILGPGAPDMAVLKFDRVPSRTLDTMTIRMQVTYGGKGVWGDDMPFAAEIRRLDDEAS